MESVECFASSQRSLPPEVVEGRLRDNEGVQGNVIAAGSRIQVRFVFLDPCVELNFRIGLQIATRDQTVGVDEGDMLEVMAFEPQDKIREELLWF